MDDFKRTFLLGRVPWKGLKVSHMLNGILFSNLDVISPILVNLEENQEGVVDGLRNQVSQLQNEACPN